MMTNVETPATSRVVAHALLALDHAPLSRALKRGLEEQNFRVTCTTRAAVQPHLMEWDFIILDVSASMEDAASVIRTWRSRGLKMPIVALTTPECNPDQASLLRAGANICLDKPFRFEELLGLLRTLAARKSSTNVSFQSHDLEIDAVSGTVKRNGRTIHLTPREFSLLHFLATHRGRLVTRRMIWEQVYQDKDASSNVVDVYIRYLRTKIDAGSDRPLIQTVWGKGYSMRAPEE